MHCLYFDAVADGGRGGQNRGIIIIRGHLQSGSEDLTDVIFPLDKKKLF
jgi:hypothetical protein